MGSDPSFAVDDIVVFAKASSCYEMSLVSYTAAGCTAGCVLTEFSGPGPFCNGTASSCGACPATGPSVSAVFSIPAGCSSTMSASFERRCNGIGCSQCTFTCNTTSSTYGCCNSGLDANDFVRIRGDQPAASIYGVNLSPGYTTNCSSNPTATITPIGSTITATGSNNGGARIFYSQTGGNIFLDVRANRLDEIVTYSLAVSPTCNCSSIVLPLTIVGFWAEYINGQKHLSWMVKNDALIKEYRLYVSTDGEYFEHIGTVPSVRLKDGTFLYSFTDESARFGQLYYKLEAVNDNVDAELMTTKYVSISAWVSPIHYRFDENGNLLIGIHEEGLIRIDLLQMDGKCIFRKQLSEEERNLVIPAEMFLSEGMFLIKAGMPSGQVQCYKVIR